MQPIVGALSDKSTSRFGRRKPFILGGSIAVVFAFISIVWTKDMIDGLFGEVGFIRCSCMCDGLSISYRVSLLYIQGTPITIWIAIFSLYSLDFAINAGKLLCGFGLLLIRHKLTEMSIKQYRQVLEHCLLIVCHHHNKRKGQLGQG